MKKYLILIVCVSLSFLLNAQITKTVTVSAGTLSSVLTTFDKDSTTNLILSGTIDARDFKTMRDEMPRLANINLSNISQIVKYIGGMGTSSIDTVYLANTIPQNAFYDADFNSRKASLDTIKLPQLITSIGKQAFFGCSISAINLPYSLSSIESEAFSQCNGLNFITIPSLVTSIGLEAFWDTKCVLNVDSSNTMYSSINGVLFNKAKSTLIHCPTSITGSYVIPSTVTSITVHAFDYCNKLNSVTIPASVTQIGGSAFGFCGGLSTIYTYSKTPIDITANLNVFAGVDTLTCILHVPMGSKSLYQSANQWKSFNIVEPNLTIATSTINLQGIMQNYVFFSIISNVQWTVTSDQQWLSFNKNAGYANDSIRIMAQPNTGTIRTATISILSDAGLKTITVTQQQSNNCPAKAPIAGVDPKLCFSSSTNKIISATAQGSGILKWFIGPNTQSSNIIFTGNNYEVTSTQPNLYTYYVAEYDTINICYSQTTPVTLTINPLPTITIFASKTTLTVGDSAKLYGSGAINYIWNSTEQAPDISVYPSTTTLYSVTGTDANGCSSIASQTITIDTAKMNIPVQAISLSQKTLALSLSSAPVAIIGTVIPANASNPLLSWKSSDTSIVRVYSGVVSVVGKIGTATVTCLATDGSGVYEICTVTVSSIAQTTVQITPMQPIVMVGKSLQLIAQVIPTPTTTNNRLIWTSSNILIATIDTMGVVTGIDSGSVVITVSMKTNPNVSSSTVVTVTNSSSPKTALLQTINMANSIKANAVVGNLPGQYSNDAMSRFSSAISNAQYIYSLNSVNVITYDTTNTNLITEITIFQNSVTGQIGIKGNLNQTLYSAQYMLNASTEGTVKGQYIVGSKAILQNAISNAQLVANDSNATQVAVDSATVKLGNAITIFQNSIYGLQGKSALFSAINETQMGLSTAVEGNLTGQYPIGSKTTLQQALSRAQYVYNDSTATGVYVDTTTTNLKLALVTFQNSKITDTLAVLPSLLTSVNPIISLTPMQTYQLLVSFTPTNTNQKALSWSSNDTNIAVVSSTGLVVSKSNVGTVQITATSVNGLTTIFTVSVTSLPISVNSVSLSPTTISLTLELSKALIVTVNPVNATTTTVRWKSSDSTVAIISSTGLVTGKKVGTSTITVTTVDGNKTATCIVTVSAIATVTKSALQKAINSAITIDSTSIEGTSVGNFPVGSKAPLKTAITKAQSIYTNTSATQSIIDSAVINLNYAINTFTSKVITTTVSKTALSQAIVAASSFDSTVVEGTVVGQYPVGTKASLKNAITNAQAVYFSTMTNQSQIQVDSATTNLNTAVAYIKTLKITTACTTFTEQLGVVTNSETSNGLIIAWNKTSGKHIKAYEIYRESSIANVYQLIATIPQNQFSAYVDKTVNSLVQAYRYKLTTIDSTCSQKAESSIHKSIHLQSNLGINGNVNLTWNAYEGVAVPVYYIYRNGVSIGTLASNSSTMYYQYTDLHPSENSIYQIVCDLPSMIDPSYSLKSDNGPFSQILSNKAETQLIITPSPIVTIPSSSIAITPKTQNNLTIGEKLALTASITPINATNKAILWKSSDSTIASVSSFGLVTAYKAGSVKITVSTTDSISKSDATSFIILPKDTISAKATFTNLSVVLGATTNAYTLADYFTGNGITYYVTSSNIAVVKPVMTADGFGLAQNSAGTATIYVTATSNRGATITKTFTVTVTSPIVVTNCTSLKVAETISNISCAGANTGSISVTVSGGAAPYRYKWSNTRSDNKITNMPAGQYTLVVTDSNSCSTVRMFEIKEKSEMIVNNIVSTPNCGASDGAIQLSVTGGTSPYSYLWDDAKTSNTILSKSAGLYSVTVTDSVGCTKTQSFSLNNTNAPVILLNSVQASHCNPNDGSISVSVNGGNGNYTYNWNDNSKIASRTNLPSGNYNLTVTDGNQCKATINVIVPSIGFKQPEISLVTVSQTSGNNLVVWIKDSTKLIDYYSIYRETNKSGIFSYVGKVSYKASSIFQDSTVNTGATSWRYRISATDYCGNESSMSAARAEFKTINLKTTSSTSTITLNWDNYEGNEIFEYIIYRNGVEIARVPASINSFVDKNALAGKNEYSVAIQLPQVLDPNGLIKSDSGPFSQSLSNMAESQLTGTSVLVESEETITISPNPTSDFVTITVSSQHDFTATVINVLGNTVTTKVGNGSIKIDCSGLAVGLYFVKITNGDVVTTKRLVVE